MSEKLFKFLLSEIAAIRVRCLNPLCGGVVEVPPNKLGPMFKGGCPLCHRQFNTKFENGTHVLEWLGKAIEELKSLNDKIEVELALPDNSYQPG